MRRVKVLRLLSNLNLGGVQKRLVGLLERMDRRKFEIIVCSFQGGIFRQELEKAGIPTLIIHRRSKFDPLCITNLMRLMRKEKIDIVHTHTHKPNTTGRIAAYLAKVPIIIAQEHNVDSWKGKFQKLLDRWLSHISERVIVVSQAVRDFYQEEVGIPPGKLAVIYNGVDLSSFPGDPLRIKRELGLEGVKVVGTVGRLHPQKGLSYFLQAAKEISLELPEVKFLIVGGGPLRKSLENMVETLGLSTQVIFTGEREDVADILSSIDVFVLSSLREGFSNVLLEAMASYRPVVATEVGGAREVIEEGKSGFLVPPGDYHRISRIVVKLLEEEEMARSLGEAARRRAEFFSLEKMVERTEKLYESLVGEKLGSWS